MVCSPFREIRLTCAPQYLRLAKCSCTYRISASVWDEGKSKAKKGCLYPNETLADVWSKGPMGKNISKGIISLDFEP